MVAVWGWSHDEGSLKIVAWEWLYERVALWGLHQYSWVRTVASVWQHWVGGVRMVASERQHQDGIISFFLLSKMSIIVSYHVCLSFFQLIWKRVSSVIFLLLAILYATMKFWWQCEDSNLRKAGWRQQHEDGCIRLALN